MICACGLTLIEWRGGVLICPTCDSMGLWAHISDLPATREDPDAS